MKIVVTGALGHIGSALIRQLPFAFPDAGIVMIDNMMTQRYASLFDLPAIGRYQFIENDVRDVDLRSLFDGADIVVPGLSIALQNSRPIISTRQRKLPLPAGKRELDSFISLQPAFTAHRTPSCRKTARAKN
jgi:hypothetical protein